MKILYFVRMFSTHDYRFLTRIAEEGHEVYFLRLEDTVLETRALPEAVKIVMWPAVEPGGAGTAHYAGKPQHQVEALKHVVAEVQPDVVQAGPVQTAAFLCVLAEVKPLVVMSWGYDIMFDAEKDPVWHSVTSNVLRKADGYICDCDALHQKAIGYGLPEDVFTGKFPWGIDTDRFQPLPEGAVNVKREELGWGDDKFVILSLRNWEPIYDVETIVKGFILAFEQDSRLRLIILGGGSREKAIHEIMAGNPAEKAITVVGRVSQDELPLYYHAADLYVSASHTDGTSISLLESFGSGLPVCVSDIPANHEWVRECVEGTFFPVGDEDALASKLTSLASMPKSYWKTKVEEIRAIAVERAQWAVNSRKLFDTFEAAAARYA